MKKIFILFALLFSGLFAQAQDSTAVKLIVGDRTFLIPRLSNVTSGGGGATQLSGLTDVNTAGITNGFVLVANGTYYEARPLVENDISNFGTYLTAEVDGSISNEIQTIDVSQLVGTDLQLSLLNDGEATKVIDLSSLQDGTGTDDQTATEVVNTPLGNLIATDVQGALNELQTEVDGLAVGGDGLGPDGDKGNISVGGTGTTLTIDAGAIDETQLDVSTNASLDLADTALQSFTEVDGSTSNEIQDLTLVGNTLAITLDPNTDVDLSPYLDNTDTQLTTEQVQDIAGGMVSGNTESLISVVYQDGDGTIDFNVSSDLALYSTANAITFDNTTQSTTKDTGGVIMQGGLGVEKDVVIGGSIVSTDEITVNSSTASTTKDTGAVIIATGGLGVEGAINAGGDITAFATSDERLKKNIRPINNAVSKVKKLSGNEYRWKKIAEMIGRQGKDVGVIAQEVEAVIPEAVRESTSGFLQVNYDKIIPLLIEAIKEQDEEIQSLKEKLKNIKKAL